MRWLIASLCCLLVACGAQYDESCCNISLVVEVPDGSGDVYLAGNLPQLGPWRPDGMLMTGSGKTRRATIQVPGGTRFEYKFTLGSWDREMLTAAGEVPGNFQLKARGDQEVFHDVVRFRADAAEYFADWRAAGIAGRMVFWPNFESATLGPSRHIEIWLPPGYDKNEEKRYPVLYMHDGQNLFDHRRANTGVDWGVDETVVRLAGDGEISPPIVVGVWSTAERGFEYSPWHGAPLYARFLIDELKPRIDAEFRTLTDPGSTAVMGSSMGGLLSYYLVTSHPGVFGACGCISTHFPLSERMTVDWFGAPADREPDRTPYILRDIENGATVPEAARYWFDYGGRGLDRSYGRTHKQIRKWLLAQGKTENVDFVIRRYPEADHNETSWRERLEDPLLFLFGQ